MDDKTRINQLEFIIREIDAALCNYCNNVEDPIPDVPLWTESVRRDFDALCDAYDLWHRRHDEIGDISQKHYAEYDQFKRIVYKIANLEYANYDRIVRDARDAIAYTEKLASVDGGE